MAHEASAKLKLPSLVVGTADIARLRRELDALYDYWHQAALRHTAANDLKMPKTSRMLDELAKLNSLDLSQRDHYDELVNQLDDVYQHAPRLHVSFATDPSSAFTAKLTDWLRANIDPVVLVQVGLEPDIAAGCMVRTANKQFDLSLRQSFKKARPVLIEKLHEQAVGTASE